MLLVNKKITFLTAASLVSAAGCAIPYADEALGGGNTCASDGDCPGGSVCTDVGGESTCIAKSTDLNTLVFEVQPAVGNGDKSFASLITSTALASKDDSQLIQLDLTLPSYVDVTPGRVYLPCAGDTPVPAKVTFQPVPELAGLLEGQIYQADSTVDDAGNGAFQVSIPPGTYNVYLEPSPDPAITPGCADAPPIFLPRQKISTDTGFAVHASAPLVLKGTLKLSEKEDFTKWYLEVVEPYTGHILSEIVQPQQMGIALEVPFQVSFDWTARADYTPIIRLRPPDGSGKPVIHWRLDAVALQGIDGAEVPVELDVSGIDTQPRQVGGFVAHDGKTVAATVTLRSLSISGDELTRYETVVETDEAGNFETALPPGEYQVIARPHRSDLAVGLKPWKIVKDSTCFCGNSVEVPSATTLSGSVLTPDGTPARVEIRLAPAAAADLPYLGAVLTPDVQPRPAGASTTDGTFQVSVDSGTFDLTIAAPSGSGYPWLVRPRLLVPAANMDAPATPVISLKPFQLQNPVLVRGMVLDSKGAALDGATVRAWMAVGDPANSGLAPSAVQIGEAVADSSGSYTLLLPPSIKEGQ